ncbi:sensor histidine kinase [Kitasatospora sp. DSM 101779]|uniref:sensor histidine kinase n=1 Tax=Kitasatospora sp. DSM 101779 TaxID=2853165 RepID=UPI0021DA2C44|nr:sensor histidine kinase [Kitasatospora sp. DSM 101779]
MDLLRPSRRWRALGKPKLTELFIRWSLYLTGLLQPLLLLGAITGKHGAELPVIVRLSAVAASLTATALFIVCCRAGLAHYLGRRPRPTGWLVAFTAGTLLCYWAVLGTTHPTAEDPVPTGVATATWLLVFWFAPVAVSVPVKATAPIGLLGLALSVPAAAVAGIPTATAIGLAVGSGIVMVFIGATWRGTAWIAAVVWELDAAREAQARLAVAEERLRFSRDLHDVLGRNLTTIALKSELAVQLARRGRTEAADQMVEVQRIAQESQREVREVVRGYRTADLAAEVAGARSVLRAAGVDCDIDLGPDSAALPLTAQSVLGWVVREATTNVLRHSEAGHCTVTLRLDGGHARLTVENDGVTGPAADRDHPGTGLLGLRERLAAHGGGLATPPADPGRFRLTASLPLDLPALEVAAP